ncbi:MAG: DinB family protein [Sciscionella sp.]
MRSAPDPVGVELVMLEQYLDYQRETMLSKTEGLTREQLAAKHPPSELTLSGLLYHLSLVEEDWLEVRFAGRPDREPWAGIDWDADPDWEFRTATHLEPEQVQQRYRQACERSRAVVSGAADLDQLSVKALRDGRHFSLRWVLLHLIEETARHAGHADFLREAIDGAVGE